MRRLRWARREGRELHWRAVPVLRLGGGPADLRSDPRASVVVACDSGVDVVTPYTLLGTRPSWHDGGAAAAAPAAAPAAAAAMDFFTFLLAYLLAVVTFIFVLLFGENPVFTGTIVHKLHWLLTQGPCSAIE